MEPRSWPDSKQAELARRGGLIHRLVREARRGARARVVRLRAGFGGEKGEEDA